MTPEQRLARLWGVLPVHGESCAVLNARIRANVRFRTERAQQRLKQYQIDQFNRYFFLAYAREPAITKL